MNVVSVADFHRMNGKAVSVCTLTDSEPDIRRKLGNKNPLPAFRRPDDVVVNVCNGCPSVN